MKGLAYLYQRTILNRVKKALKRPAAYLMAVFILLYVLLIWNSINTMMADGDFNSTENYVTILSILVYLLIPANLISYARRRGLLFRPSEVHFVFSSPVSPKKVLMFAGVKSFSVNILIGTVIAVAGAIWFEASMLQAFMFFLFLLVFRSVDQMY